MLKFKFIFLLLLCSCSQRVINYMSPNARFQSYESYFIVNYKANQRELSSDGESVISQIERYIAGEMHRRDYVRSPSEPDLLVRFELIANQVTKVDRTSTGFYSPFYGPGFISTRTILESALLIEINETRTKKLVWQASMDLKQYSRKKKKEEVLQEAVAQLFNNYLYRAGSSQPDESLVTEK